MRIVVARRAPDVLPEAGALTLTLALALLKAGAAQTCGAARGCGERGGGALYTVRTVHNVRTGMRMSRQRGAWNRNAVNCATPEAILTFTFPCLLLKMCEGQTHAYCALPPLHNRAPHPYEACNPP